MSLSSQKYTHSVLGKVNLKVLSTARRFTARWKGDILHMTIPAGIDLDEYNRVLDRMTPDILASRPVIGRKYFPGYTFANDLFGIRVVESPQTRKGEIDAIPFTKEKPPVYEFRVAPGTLDSDSIQSRLSKFIGKCAYGPASHYLLPELDELIVELGFQDRVRLTEITRASAKYGDCSNRGKVRLAARVLYMPKLFRRAVMTHELAHLDHFDHTPQFYVRWQQLFPEFDVRTFHKRLRTVDLPLLR